jgi:hypothetical protein
MNKILEVVVSEYADPEGYIIQIFVDDADGKEVMILKIDQNYYFPEYFGDQPYYSYVISKGHPNININANIPISAISYDFNHEKITQAVRGFAVMSSTNIYQKLDLLPTTENDPSAWRNGSLVDKVEGPYQDGKIVAEIDLKKRIYYLATPNSQEIHNTQILSIKWEYQYNDGQYTQFKNSVRSVVNDKGVRKCRIDCGFLEKDDIFFITIYPFFKSRGVNVFNRTSTTNKKQSTEGVLIWSALVTPEFEQKVIAICAELYGEEKKLEMANTLMAIMSVETARTFKAHIIAGQNAKTLIPPESITKDDFKNGEDSSKAVGLIQFTQSALEQLGDFKGGSGFDKLHEVKLKYARMGEIKQLDKVRDYLYPSRNKITTPEDMYLQIFAPTGVGKGNSFVLYSYPSKEYNDNKSLDEEGNYNKKIERGELLKRYYSLYKEGENYIRSGGSNQIEAGNEQPSESQESIGVWHDPVDNPRITKYNYYGSVKPASGAYGYARRTSNGTKKFHSGFDFFALPGKVNVYACLDGTLQQVRYSDTAGWIVRVKINNVSELLAQEKKVKYKLSFQDELNGRDITEKDSAYLIYMHLQKVFFTAEDADKKVVVKSGTALGFAGVSGTIASGARAPHLHMEIATVLDAYGTGETNRTNPARFVKINSYDTPDQDEASKKAHIHKK